MRSMVMASALALGLTATTMAADPQVQAELDALKAQVQQQSAELQELRTQSGESWLNQRRAEEIKSLIHEVLSDAETRASLQEGGLTAGWRDHFFLASEDGNFLLRVGGQVQTRYLLAYNNPDGEEDLDDREHHEGFEMRRAMISFDGHLFDPKFTYQVSLLMSDSDPLVTERRDTFTPEFDPVTGDLVGGTAGTATDGSGRAALQNAWFAYEFADGWQVKAGQFKGPFLRDELVHSSRQLAVERALITDMLTIDYTQGAQLGYNGELSGTPLRAAVMVHDGSYFANTPAVPGEDTDFAIAARAELLAAGAWEQFDDYAAWSDDSFGLLIGAAIDYENAEGEDSTTGTDLLKWTVDGSIEVPEAAGFNAMAALTGRHTDGREDTAGGDADQWAVLAQAGIFIVPDQVDVFGRWEFIDLDGQTIGGAEIDGGADEIHILTFGGNYYFQRHAAKATVDVLWALDGTQNLADGFVGGNGLFPTSEDDQLVLRGQFQFLF